ncbi:MAG TPA: ferritin-like domain-containing protein [Bryobacteraceae bacterium]|jgi:ferritin-like metal-binding protein YciE|nr:ferritin-like domain-containing protein [Bryobacteraceae bacterium]
MSKGQETASLENTGHAAILHYLEDALAAEKGAEAQLRAFAAEGDDDDVKQSFAAHAEESQVQSQHLAKRLEELGGDPQVSARNLASPPPVLPMALAAEERMVQNLLAAYTEEATECAMYQVLIDIARGAGDEATVDLARIIQAEAHRAADKFWSFIPSRSIIAYNILTIGEIDPSVETKVGEVSWT